ncbi:unnamed protein product [Rotaria sordida]|uniref:F-box domain-containing protein n=1 Tax=Rotaria sordida TaxID=392033 RepID=A0A815T3J8_9BILA|nr:unnamed protein product [Rotaria sordida]CAF4170354.1 unnamed protein product [Rotaria sordida]
MIQPHADRIQSFQLSHPFAADLCLLVMPLMRNFIQLETLIINNIESDSLEEVINHLSCLPILSSVTITSNGYVRNQNDLYLKIFHLPMLKYCQMLVETLRFRIPLPVATNRFSPIEHLVIKHAISLNQIDSFLSYVPYLSRLSLTAFDGWRGYRTKNNSIILNHLTDVSLGLTDIDFNHFEVLVRDLFSQVQVLRISSGYERHSYWNMEYLNADRWEQLISIHMPNIRIFDFQYRYYRWIDNSGRQSFEESIYASNPASSSQSRLIQQSTEEQQYRSPQDLIRHRGDYESIARANIRSQQQQQLQVYSPTNQRLLLQYPNPNHYQQSDLIQYGSPTLSASSSCRQQQ